jgi:hypothetical protein
MKAESFLAVKCAQAGHKLTSKYAAEDCDWQKEAVPRRNPAGMIHSQPASRNDTVHVRVVTPTPTIP